MRKKYFIKPIKPWPVPPRPSKAIKNCLKPSISQLVYEKRHFLSTLIRFDAYLAGMESKCVTQRFAVDDRLIVRIPSAAHVGWLGNSENSEKTAA